MTGEAHDRLAGLDPDRLRELADLRSPHVHGPTAAQVEACPFRSLSPAHYRPNGGHCYCVGDDERPCRVCGAPGWPWCSTSCHRADDPGAYEPDDPEPAE